MKNPPLRRGGSCLLRFFPHGYFKGGKLPDNLLPPVTAGLEITEICQPPVVGVKQVKQEVQFGIVPRL